MFNIIEQLKNAVQNIKTITGDLSDLYQKHPFVVCISLVSVTFFGAIYVEKKFALTDFFYQDVQAEEKAEFDDLSHEEVLEIIASRIEDINFLSILANEQGLYRVEKMARFLDSKYRGQELTNETFEEINVLAFEEKINQHNLYHKLGGLTASNSTSKDDNNFPENHDEFLEKTKSSIQPQLFAAEFVHNNAFKTKTAASCTNSDIYERTVELKNIYNLENNVQLDVVNPIRCNTRNERFSCGSSFKDIEKIQVTFETAAKLFPDKYNPNVHNTLGKCEYVHATVIH